jgi:hypothetical protein
MTQEISKNSVVLRIAETGHPDHLDLHTCGLAIDHKPWLRLQEGWKRMV